MDVLNLLPSPAWGILLGYLLDVFILVGVPLERIRTWRRYAPLRWAMGPDLETVRGGRIVVLVLAMIVLIPCSIGSAWYHPAGSFLGLAIYLLSYALAQRKIAKPPAEADKGVT